ncbi:MAG: AAA family ATPase [Methyloprofundus sp.]|nr:AAA family ATPase [Methyloprofundus sp.]
MTPLKEGVEVECKLAQGRNGNGSLPKDFWETYSAFANTTGGDVFLGLKEEKLGQFELAGIQEPQKVIDELWTNLNNFEKVSTNILQNQHVNVLEIDNYQIIHIHVPQALRTQRPVYIKDNPLLGTFKRFNSADIKQDNESVKRMLAEQLEDSSDSLILKGFLIDDLDVESFNTYRQLYSNQQPDHPWNQLDTQEFLYRIGGWGRDRESGHSGLTRAGLLMFGHLRTIKDAFPNYMLDYQERSEPKAELRWVDRLTLDGTWSGNVFDFYRLVIRKLTADLKVPFVLKGDQRQDDTPVHKALREAFVNALVHADFSGRASVLVVKRPDMFGFRNPGCMRVPIDLALEGGNSDCRNHSLQGMFGFIGLGEHAGSGLPKILQGWKSQHWRQPMLREKQEPSEQTLLELHTLSFLPEDVLQKLQIQIGENEFSQLSENEIVILVTACIESTVDHSRIMSMLEIHPHDLTVLFADLVEKGLILQEGSGRGTIYFFPETRRADTILDSVLTEPHNSGTSEVSLGGSGVNSGGSELSSGGLDDLVLIAKSIASKKRAPKEDMEAMLIKLCAIRPLRLEELEKVVNRSGDFLSKDYLRPLVKAKRLCLLFPTKPNHPKQAYITLKGENTK